MIAFKPSRQFRCVICIFNFNITIKNIPPFQFVQYRPTMVLNHLKLSPGGLPLLKSPPEMDIEMSLEECRKLKCFLKCVYKFTRETSPSDTYVIQNLTQAVLRYGALDIPIKMANHPMVYMWPIGVDELYCMVNMSYKDDVVSVYSFQLYRCDAEGKIIERGFPILTPSVRLPFQYIHP